MCPLIIPPETSGAVAPRKSQSRKGRVRRRAGHRIKASSARISWSLHPQTNRVIDVWVSTTDQPVELFTREYYSPRWGFVVGNCDVDWLHHPEFMPEAVFGQLIKIGFHSSAELVNALRQFDKVDTCKWAAAMLGRLGATP